MTDHHRPGVFIGRDGLTYAYRYTDRGDPLVQPLGTRRERVPTSAELAEIEADQRRQARKRQR